MSEEFRKCLKQERDRARSRRESAQGKFEASMQSLDRLFDTFEDPSKAAAFSDGGAGEERIVAGCDGDGSPAYYRTCVKRALNRLRKWGRIQGIGSGPGRVMIWCVVADDTPLPDGRDGMC